LINPLFQRTKHQQLSLLHPSHNDCDGGDLFCFTSVIAELGARPPSGKGAMLTRTSKKTVTFKEPFIFGKFDETQAAGDYVVETDEELIQGLSFPAYRRVLTLIHLHAKSGRPGTKHILTIDPADLDAALARDQASSKF